MALNDKIFYEKRSKSCLKNKNLSFEKSGQKTEQSKQSYGTTHTSPKMRTRPEKSERMVTLYTHDNTGANMGCLYIVLISFYISEIVPA